MFSMRQNLLLEERGTRRGLESGRTDFIRRLPKRWMRAVMQSQGPVYLSGAAPVLVANLPHDVLERELEAHFSSLPGRIFIDRSRQFKSTASATLLYPSKSTAQLAVKLFTGTDFRSRSLVIALDERGLQAAELQLRCSRGGCQVYLGGLPHYTTHAQILRHFEGHSSLCCLDKSLPNLRNFIVEVRFRCMQGRGLCNIGIGEVLFKHITAAREAAKHYNKVNFTYGVPRRSSSAAGLVWIWDQELLCQRSMGEALAFNTLLGRPPVLSTVPHTRNTDFMLFTECVPPEQRGPEPEPTDSLHAAEHLPPAPPSPPSPPLQPSPPSPPPADSPPGTPSTARGGPPTLLGTPLTSMIGSPQRVAMSPLAMNSAAGSFANFQSLHKQRDDQPIPTAALLQAARKVLITEALLQPRSALADTSGAEFPGR